MTTEHDFAARVVGAIQEREIAPRPRWTFIARNALLGLLLVLSVFFGAMTVATSEFLLIDRDWDLALELSQRNTIATIESLPYLWLAALILLVLLTYQLVTRTKRGYRFAPVTVLGGSVLMSLAIGSALYVAGLGTRTHELVRREIPVYDRFVVSRDRFWSNPAQGLLGGQIVEATTSAAFLLRDAQGQDWLVLVTGDADGVATGAYVRALGRQQGSSTFAAQTVLPWPRRVVASSTPY